MSYESLFFISKIPGTKMFDLLKKEVMCVCVCVVVGGNVF